MDLEDYWIFYLAWDLQLLIIVYSMKFQQFIIHSLIFYHQSGALVQYVGDNADINVHTLDGNNTLHVMGMIKIVTPKNVIYDERIQKYTTKPSAKELAAISHVSLQVYEKPVVPGYSKVQVENLHDHQAFTEKNLNGVDFFVVIWKV
ncbi:hypothetical protein PR048_011198 [Dryococelus australis]|uniref:Uncharacterized protein n=1 Tax=Dryococelus australis TaxID=614101 RepID=A0ABQ9HKY8_9NEOP|nr:hypothetical protein PR048_011198 [Dryococelus australis]